MYLLTTPRTHFPHCHSPRQRLRNLIPSVLPESLVSSPLALFPNPFSIAIVVSLSVICFVGVSVGFVSGFLFPSSHMKSLLWYGRPTRSFLPVSPVANSSTSLVSRFV